MFERVARLDDHCIERAPCVQGPGPLLHIRPPREQRHLKVKPSCLPAPCAEQRAAICERLEGGDAETGSRCRPRRLLKGEQQQKKKTEEKKKRKKHNNPLCLENNILLHVLIGPG